MYIGFANFYYCFIWSFSKITILLISILKTTALSNLALKVFKTNNNEIIGVGS